MRHINFFLGAQNGGLGWGGKKVYVEKVHVLLPSLTKITGANDFADFAGKSYEAGGPRKIEKTTSSQYRYEDFIWY